MKVGPQSQTLVSLTSLLNASKQQQQEDQKAKEIQNPRDERVANRVSDRNQLIQQNRAAIEKISDDIRIKSLSNLTKNSDVQGGRNLNLRENLSGNEGQPLFKNLGQIVDIKV
jgi:hypothetical protein